MIADDRDYQASALLAGKPLTNRDIRDAELARARHALVYLKQKLGDEATRDLLKEDLAAMNARCGTGSRRPVGRGRAVRWS